MAAGAVDGPDCFARFAPATPTIKKKNNYFPPLSAEAPSRVSPYLCVSAVVTGRCITDFFISILGL